MYMFNNLANYGNINLYICEQICQKGFYTHTVISLPFHGHSTDATID